MSHVLQNSLMQRGKNTEIRQLKSCSCAKRMISLKAELIKISVGLFWTQNPWSFLSDCNNDESDISGHEYYDKAARRTQTHTHIHIHTHTHTYIHTDAHIQIHIHTHTHTHVQAHTHTYSHTICNRRILPQLCQVRPMNSCVEEFHIMFFVAPSFDEMPGFFWLFCSNSTSFFASISFPSVAVMKPVDCYFSSHSSSSSCCHCCCYCRGARTVPSLACCLLLQPPLRLLLPLLPRIIHRPRSLFQQ